MSKRYFYVSAMITFTDREEFDIGQFFVAVDGLPYIDHLQDFIADIYENVEEVMVLGLSEFADYELMKMRDHFNEQSDKRGLSPKSGKPKDNPLDNIIDGFRLN